MSKALLEQACVLIVEDEENNRLVAIKLLELEGVPPENIFATAGDPWPFLETFPDKLDLVLLDLQLPGKDGYKVLQELKNSEQFGQTPVMAMTANVMKTDIAQMRAAGFDGFIGKPINARRFGDWIKRCLVGQAVWPGN